MGRLIVVAFTTLDGIVEDPDGSDATPFGGWAMRYGPEGVAGDKFGLGAILEHGTLLFGRRTWDHFRTLWPPRDNDFARAMNAARKAVVTSRPVDEAGWTNSRAIDAPLADWVRREVTTTDLAVIGSMSVVAQLAELDLVQEYRLLQFPVVLGAGRGLFTGRHELSLAATAQVGPGVLSTFEVVAASPA
jgi:dihydrofolate reductase